MTQNNLGEALRAQGTRSGGEAGRRLLGEAVAAYRNALEVYTRAQLPQDWARTQNNLGAALGDLGMRSDGEAGRRLLGEAVVAFRNALEVYKAIGADYYVNMVENNLRRAEAALSNIKDVM